MEDIFTTIVKQKGEGVKQGKHDKVLYLKKNKMTNINSRKGKPSTFQDLFSVSLSTS
jgi:hypothetical protein